MSDITSILSSQVLQFLSAKHQVIGDNIANNNMPAYKANKLEMPKNFLSLINKSATPNHMQMSTSSPRHLGGYISSLNYRTTKDMSGTKKINGNNVSLKDQIMNISGNQVEYDRALKSYMHANSLIGIALGNKG